MRTTQRWRRAVAAVVTTMVVAGTVGCIPQFDFNKDFKADRVWISQDTGQWHRQGTTAPLFTQPLSSEPVAADYDGNGTLDAAYVDGTTWTYRNTVGVLDKAAGLPTVATDHVITMPVPSKNSPSDSLIPVPADYNGDGNAEPAWYRESDATWFVKDRAPVQFGLGASKVQYWNDIPVPADYDGDGDADLATYRPGDATWRVLGSAAVVPLGTKGNYPVPGDWNGDGKDEMAVYGYDRNQPLTPARWLVAGTASPVVAPVGVGDLPVPADYSGDGRLDPGYFDSTSGAWTYGSNGPGLTTQLRPNFIDRPASMPAYLVESVIRLTFLDKCAISLQRGDISPNCPPVPEPQTCTTLTPSTLCEPHGTAYDFTGDGKADRVSIDGATGKWFLEGNATPFAQSPTASTGAMYVPGDYDGDGTWEAAYVDADKTHWVTSGAAGTITSPVPDPQGPPPSVAGWFLPGPNLFPVPADYDGDGRTDPGWYRRSDSAWFLPGQAPLQFGTGYVAAVGWHDIPVPADYDGDGVSEVATYSPGTGTFHIQDVADAIDVGDMGNWPAPADYDGDGKVDPATMGYNRATGLGPPVWTIRRSSTDTTTTAAQSAPLLSYPTSADYDGDGRADLSGINEETGEWWAAGKSSISLPMANYMPTKVPATWYWPLSVEWLRLSALDHCAVYVYATVSWSASFASFCPAGPMPS